MALSPSNLQNLLQAQFSANGIAGQAGPEVSNALSTAIYTSIIANAQVTTIDVGSAGSGVGSSTVLGINAGVLAPLMIANFSSAGIVGAYSAALALAISTAFATWFLTNQTQTIHTGVGVGTGTGKVVGLDPTSMGSLITSFMAAEGVAGTFSSPLSQQIALANVTHVLAVGTVFTPIVGSPSPSPSTGTGFGKVF